MKNLLFIITLFCLNYGIVQAQESFEGRAKEIAKKIESVTLEEKEKLSAEITKINERMERNEITKQDAEKLHREAADKSAKIIEQKVEAYAEELQTLVQDKIDGKINEERKEDKIKEKGDRNVYSDWNWDFNFDKKKKVKGEPRTTSQLVFAFGKNALANNGSLSDIETNDIKILRSRYYEIGMTANTRLFKSHNLLHLKYGLSFAFNNLRPTNNRYFVVNGNQTELIKDNFNTFTKLPYFRNVQLLAPVHLEFDFTKPRMKDDQKIFRSHKALRVGIGGYVGLNTDTKQYLQYSNNNYDSELRINGDYNISDFIYGLSTYIGYRETSLYFRYDLNPLFKNNPIDQNNLAIGLRFDFN